MATYGLHDDVSRQAGLRFFRDRHHNLQRLGSWNFLCRIQNVLDGIFVEVAFEERRRVTTIEELTRLADLEVDARPAVLNVLVRRRPSLLINSP